MTNKLKHQIHTILDNRYVPVNTEEEMRKAFQEDRVYIEIDGEFVKLTNEATVRAEDEQT